MAKVTFDGDNKIIQVEDGIIYLAFAEDVYSEWKRWILEDDNTKYLQAIRVVGGDPISDVKNLGSTFFMLNGWKLRPWAANHRLTLEGNVFTDPSGESIFVPALGSYSVTIEMSVSNLSDSSLAQLPEIEYSSFNGAVWVSTAGAAGVDFPLGTPKNPVNNLTDAVTIAVYRGFTKLEFLSNFTFPAGTFIQNFEFSGQGLSKTTLTFENGSIVPLCKISDCKLTGQSLGINAIENCYIDNFAGSGLIPTSQKLYVQNCIFAGEIGLPSNYTGEIIAVNCCAGTGGSNIPSFNMNGGAFNIVLRNWSGGFSIKNCTSPLASCYISFTSGRIVLEPSITAGTFALRGVCKIEDNSTSVTSLDITDVVSNVWEKVLENGMSAESVLKVLFAVMAGETTIVETGIGTATVIFKSADQTINRVTADMVGSERVNIELDLTG